MMMMRKGGDGVGEIRNTRRTRKIRRGLISTLVTGLNQ